MKYHDFCCQCRLVSNLLFSAEKKYYLNIFHEHRRNTKQVFKVCNSLLGKSKDLPLPPSYTNQELADNFNGFSTTKITHIRSKLIEQYLGLSDMLTEQCTIPQVFENYQTFSCDDVLKIVLASPSKSCEADPIAQEDTTSIEFLTKLVNELL